MEGRKPSLADGNGHKGRIINLHVYNRRMDTTGYKVCFWAPGKLWHMKKREWFSFFFLG